MMMLFQPNSVGSNSCERLNRTFKMSYRITMVITVMRVPCTEFPVGAYYNFQDRIPIITGNL